MSFAEQVFGWLVDYGDALPRRARRLAGLVGLLLMLLAPRFYVRVAVGYAEHQARTTMTQLLQSLPRVPPHTATPPPP